VEKSACMAGFTRIGSVSRPRVGINTRPMHVQVGYWDKEAFNSLRCVLLPVQVRRA
jgi:hypothetical protein